MKNLASASEHRRRRSLRRTWIYLRPRLLPGVFMLIGVGLVAYIGIASFSKKPPSASVTTLFILLATLCQVGGATVFGRVGRVDRNHARSAVRRVVSVGVALTRARTLLRDSKSPHLAVEELLANACRDLEFSILDWNDVYSDALHDVLEDAKNAE